MYRALSHGHISELCLLVQSSFSSSPILSEIERLKLPYSFFSSTLHHPRAILFHRIKPPSKISNFTFLESTAKLVCILIDGAELVEEMNLLQEYIDRYESIGAKVIVLLQGTLDYFEAAMFTQQTVGKEDYENWLAQAILRGVECLETDSVKQTGEMIGRMFRVVVEGPYKSEPTPYNATTKKISHSSVLNQDTKLWASQLVNIPGVSEHKANAIVSAYPNMRSLLSVYDDHYISTKQKKHLLASLGDKQQKKLSERVYRVYNSLDPNEEL